MLAARLTVVCTVAVIAAIPVPGQSTQGVIRGRVVAALDGAGVAGANIICRSTSLDLIGQTLSDKNGYYALTSLSPGTYRLRVEKSGYRPVEFQELELHVAARLELDFPLNTADETVSGSHYSGAILPRRREILPIFGLDLDASSRSIILDPVAARAGTLQPSLSYVIDPQQLMELPLLTRNVYTLLATVPGVVAEDRTGRGLGISVNGQRPSSSSYLLDGAENNDDVTTGPFTTINPETLKEYRVTTANLSAEFGGTGGFVANAITRSGGQGYHGSAYGYLFNEALSANTSINKTFGTPRQAYKQLHAGITASGPLWRERLMFSTSFERFRSRSRTAEELFLVPSLTGLEQCASALGVAIAAPIRSALTAFPPPPVPTAGGPCETESVSGFYTTTRPVSFDRYTGMARLDYLSRSSNHRLTGRFLLSQFAQPDFVFSVYANSNSTLSRNTSGFTGSYTWQASPTLANEARFAVRGGRVRFARPNREVPAIQMLLFRDIPREFNTPGSDQAWELDSQSSSFEVSDTLTRSFGRHTVAAGGGVLLRSPHIRLPAVADGRYDFGVPGSTSQPERFNFEAISRFITNSPNVLDYSISRRHWLESGEIRPANPQFDYDNRQFFGFVQDSFRAARRVSISLGVRYEYFGTLRSTGETDGILELGPGSSVGDRLTRAKLVYEGAGADRLYEPDRNNWAGRLAFAWDPAGTGRVVFRAGSGTYYERFFDNPFVGNRNRTAILSFCVVVQVPQCANPYGSSMLLKPGSVAQVVPQIAPNLLIPGDNRFLTRNYNEVLWIDRNLRSPYVQSWFTAVQVRVAANTTAEISHTGAVARKLLTTDYVNRSCSVGCTSQQQIGGRFNPSLGDIVYRSNSGASSYAGLGATLRHASSLVTAQASYTFSHSIDNQSDALVGDLYNLWQTYPEGAAASQQPSVFTRQFDSRADRGSSDFDLRHNAAFLSIWSLPRFGRSAWERSVTGGWRAAQFAFIRSGFPYTRYAGAGAIPGYTAVTYAASGGLLLANRANLTGETATLEKPLQLPGRVYLLDNTVLRTPANTLGSLGRNSLPGPGFWNMDVSLARNFRIGGRLEGAELEVRADAFNVFNHANLTTPVDGTSYRGPVRAEAAFPAVSPLYPTPRRIQLQIRLAF